MAFVTAVALAAGAVGYGIRGWNGDSAAMLGGGDWMSIENFYTPKSFSEVESTRAMLDALAMRYATCVDLGQLHSPAEKAAAPAVLRRSEQARQRVQHLEEGIRQFKGSEQEYLLIRRLLTVLGRQRDPDRWLEIYLDALYRRPTADLVGLLAIEAAAAGEASGRLEEVHAAFQHVCETPLDFPAKGRVLEAMKNTFGNLPSLTGQKPQPLASSSPK